MGSEGRVEVEHAVYTLCGVAEAGGVPEVSDDRLVGAGPASDAGPALVTHNSPSRIVAALPTVGWDVSDSA